MKNNAFLITMVLFMLLAPQFTAADSSSWTIETIEKGGAPSSMCLDENGHPHIAYFDDSEQSIGYTWFDGDSWEKSILPQQGGPFLSMALDSDGTPCIAYSGDDGLYYASWNSEYEVWNTSNIDQYVTVSSISLAIGPSGNPHICYSEISPYLEHESTLKYAVFDGNNWSIEALIQEKTIGDHISMAIDRSGNPHICYTAIDNGDTVKYLTFDSTLKTEVISSHGIRPSLVLDDKGNPHVSYADTSTRHLSYAWFDGSKWNTETIDSDGEVGVYSSIALDSKGNPHIAYYDSKQGNLKYSWFDGSKWNTETIDSDGDVGRWPSICIDKDDVSHISYGDYTNHELKYARGTGQIQSGIGGASSSIIIASLVVMLVVGLAILVIFHHKKLSKDMQKEE